MSTQIEAIVLKSFDYQEHHKIIKVISPSHGLISIFVGYANKRKSRYRALTEPLTLITLNAKEPTQPQNGLYFLVHGDVLDAFYELKVDYQSIMMFYEMAEIILKGDMEPQFLPFIYRTFKDVLMFPTTYLETLALGVIVFKAKSLVPLGIGPASDACLKCHSKKNIVTASVTEGGLICSACYRGGGIWLKPENIPLWRALFKVPTSKFATVEITAAQIEELEIWFKSYYETYTAIRFLKRLNI